MRAATVASVSMSGFVAHLRLHGFAVGAAETILALDALAIAQVSPAQLTAKTVLRSVFSSDCGEWAFFNELFETYWHGSGVRHARSKGLSTTARRLWHQTLPQLEETNLSDEQRDQAKAGENGNGNGSAAQTGLAAHHLATSKPAAPHQVSGRERMLLLSLGESVSRMLSRRRSRRYVAARRGTGLDFRRTLRTSVSSGGEAFVLLRRRRKKTAARLAVLLDVSDSMQAHKDFFRYFLKGILRGSLRAEGFVFYTRLIRVTAALGANDAAKTKLSFALHPHDEGGGTRIAASLDSFRRLYGRRCLGGRSVVLIISDGYDSDHPEHMRKAIGALRKQSPRIFWLSPALAEADSPMPKPRALAAALPALSALSPARTIEQLASLETRWQNL